MVALMDAKKVDSKVEPTAGSMVVVTVASRAVNSAAEWVDCLAARMAGMTADLTAALLGAL